MNGSGIGYACRVRGEDKKTRAHRIAAELGPLFEAARVPMIVVKPDGAFVSANPLALTRYGYTLEELLEMRIHDLVVDDRDVDGDLCLAGSNGPVPLDRRRHRTKGGEILWVLPAANGMVLCGEPYVVSILQDVTPIALAEARAKEDQMRADALWRAASERLTDGIALISRSFRILHVNSALQGLLRIGEADLVGRPCGEVFPSCNRESPCWHRVAVANQKRFVREFYSSRSGRPMRLEIVPTAPDNPHFAAVHVAHDQTEERAMRSELISADRLATIGRLAAGVAHEVNNPAALVTVNLGVLRDRFVTGAARPADVLTMLDESLDGMARIRDIVHDLKGFARERARERVELGEIATSAIRMAAHATRGRATVEKLLEADTWAMARSARIAQVVLNLLINAVQAFPLEPHPDNRIVVRTFRHGDRACIEVADTGPGIPMDLTERIFEPFFTTREASGGTGLGLWLARQIVEEEGGSIELRGDSTRGAAFLVSLTAAPQ